MQRTAKILDAFRTLIKVSPASSGSCLQGQHVLVLVFDFPDHPGAVEDDVTSPSPSFSLNWLEIFMQDGNQISS